MKWVLGIDPGLKGSFVIFNGEEFKCFEMPTTDDGKNRFIHFDGVHELLFDIGKKYGNVECLLERAVSFGMGTKSAFNYGRGFAAIEIAIEILEIPVTHIEPGKWAKEMHAGISSDIKPKAKSLIAVKRLFPKLVGRLPRDRKGKILEGALDAFLIAAYGLRKRTPEEPDFM